MRALRLFGDTFGRVRAALDACERVKGGLLLTTRKRLLLESVSRSLQVAKCIEDVAADLQSPAVEAELEAVEHMAAGLGIRAHYDSASRGFVLRVERAVSEGLPSMEMHLRSCWVEKNDRPDQRETLYFHELKDIEQHYKLEYPRNSPKFIRDIFRKNFENELLDPRNPLGVPTRAPPLRVLLDFGRFRVELHCRFGKVNIRRVESGEGAERPYRIGGMNLPRPVQQVVFGVVSEGVGLGEEELYRLHRLAYVGGRVQELQFLVRLFHALCPSEGGSDG